MSQCSARARLRQSVLVISVFICQVFSCIVPMVNLEMHLSKAGERSLNPGQITRRRVRASPLFLLPVPLPVPAASIVPAAPCRLSLPPARLRVAPTGLWEHRGGRVGQRSCCRVRCRAESGDTVLRSPSNTTSLFGTERDEAGGQLFASASSGGAATAAAGVPARGCVMSCI